jgi:uncharacterized protein YndB with AHSA1/START domain
MKPVTATVTVPRPREEVFDFLDVLGNHERFTDHFLVEWELSGPPAGVGARARMRLKKPGPPDWLDMKVVAAERPEATVEESVSAKGRRRTRGTYMLADAPGGGTRISFRLEWLQAPLSDRLATALTRAIAGRSNAKSLRRLAHLFNDRSKEETR